MNKLIVSLSRNIQNRVSAPSSGSSSGLDGDSLANGCEYAYVLANDAQTLIHSGTTALSLLPQAEKTILVAPAQALSWHQIDLPKVPKARLRVVLDGLLEDRLLDDTSAISFALSPDATPGKAATGVWVAACDKAWLIDSIATFEMAGCRVTQVVPEFWPVPEAVVCVTGSEDRALLTYASMDGVLTFPLHNNDLAGSNSALLADSPANATIMAEPAVAALAEKALARPVMLRQSAAGLLQSAQSPWELAQFEQRLSGDGEGIKRLRRALQSFLHTAGWRPARWGLVAVLLANFIGLNAWALQQKSNLDAKRAQLGLLLTSAFPSVKVVVDPHLQMAKELALLRQATGAITPQHFESMLSVISASADANIEPTAIEYATNAVTLEGVKLADSELFMMQTKLKTAGYSFKMDGIRAIIKTDTEL